jgi:hypothetical protein
MKRILIVVAAGMLGLSGAAFAAEKVNDTGPGCGLGVMLWKDYAKQKAILPQVLMATTNGTGFNTIAISMGTSGCTNSGKFAQNEKVNLYATVNFDSLMQEMAQGHGEHLASLAALIGIPDEHQAEFFALTQQQYRSLVQSQAPTSGGMLIALHDAIGGHPVLASTPAAR